MKLSPLLLLGIIGLNAVVGIGQNQTVLDNVNGKLIRYVETKSPEKTYIHTDKAIYFSGETIWYKAYLVDGIYHSVSDNSKVVYVELVNSKDSVLVKQTLFIESIGAAGNIELPETIVDGNYTLRAYSKYMLNEKEPLIFSKQLTIFQYKNSITTPALSRADQEELSELKLQKDLIIDFYPEGGTLVYGIENTLGIKITDTDGNEISTNGKIIDQHNTTINNFETHEFGLGKVSYLPQSGNGYFASILVNNQEKKIALPIPQDKGYVLNLVQTTEHITIKVSSNIENGLKESLIVGHTRGLVLLQHSIDVQGSTYLLRIPKKNLEDGVAHFTLFTANGEPVCERLLFINNLENRKLLKINQPTHAYKKREKVTLGLSLRNLQGKEPVGNFSAAVVEDTGKKMNSSQTIASWLLLNSDVGGTIANTDFFFEEDTVKKRYLLDALMLTHGWRRFIWKELLAEKVSKANPYEPEKGIFVKGKTIDFKNKNLPKESELNFTVLGSNFFNEVKSTDINGNFTFGPFFFQDTIQAVIQTKPKNLAGLKSENEFKIQINEFTTIPHQLPLKNFNSTIEYEYPIRRLKIDSQKKEILDDNLDSKTIILNNVTVSEKGKNARAILLDKINKVTIHGEPYTRVFIDSMEVNSTSNIFDLIRHIPGVFVIGILGTQDALFRRQPVVYFVDGLQVNNVYVNFLSPSEVEFIDFLRDPINKLSYNVTSENVIAIYTKKRLQKNITNQEPSPNIANITLKGFHKTREFYSPRYDIPKVEHKQPDFRTTLHWEPIIIVSEDGTATIDFYTGDLLGKYHIHVEGITAEGVPLSVMERFEVVE